MLHINETGTQTCNEEVAMKPSRMWFVIAVLYLIGAVLTDSHVIERGFWAAIICSQIWGARGR